jgi:hypothetical protein
VSPRIGKIVGSILRTWNRTPGGRSGNARLISDSTCSCAATMSVPQPKLTEMSAEPRELVERMLPTSGTLRRACSSGRVTSTIIRSAGRSPASMLTAILGKSMLGNRATGNCQAATAPPTAATTIRNSTDRRCAMSHAVTICQRPAWIPLTAGRGAHLLRPKRLCRRRGLWRPRPPSHPARPVERPCHLPTRSCRP